MDIDKQFELAWNPKEPYFIIDYDKSYLPELKLILERVSHRVSMETVAKANFTLETNNLLKFPRVLLYPIECLSRTSENLIFNVKLYGSYRELTKYRNLSGEISPLELVKAHIESRKVLEDNND
jgi:hypothetical protein